MAVAVVVSTPRPLVRFGQCLFAPAVPSRARGWAHGSVSWRSRSPPAGSCTLQPAWHGKGDGIRGRQPNRAVPCVSSCPCPSFRPAVETWSRPTDRQCGPLEPTTRAGLPLVVTMAWSVSDPSGTGRGSLQPASYRPLMFALTFDRHKNQIVQANLIVSFHLVILTEKFLLIVQQPLPQSPAVAHFTRTVRPDSGCGCAMSIR